jgi:hypothetical protein
MTKTSAPAEVVQAAAAFMKHNGLCGIVGGYGYCTCGMEKARESLLNTRPPAATLDPATVEAIAGCLVDQQDEPCWTINGGNYSARMNYWRDKAINCSNALVALASKTVDAGEGTP